MKRKPEPITPDFISEVRAACDARRQADSALFDLLCRVYRNPFHWRIPDDYFHAALAWLNRHDPDVRYCARCRNAMARQIAHDIDDLFINGDPDGDPPTRATKAHAARSRSKASPRVPKVKRMSDRQRAAKRRERKRLREDKEWADNIAFDEP